MNSVQAVQSAREQISVLTGLRPDTVSKLQKHGEGWLVVVELIEMKAVPDSKDMLATYEVTLDATGDLQSYERKGRYRRGDIS